MSIFTEKSQENGCSLLGGDTSLRYSLLVFLQRRCHFNSKINFYFMQNVLEVFTPAKINEWRSISSGVFEHG